jgi:hypothetical protein
MNTLAARIENLLSPNGATAGGAMAIGAHVWEFPGNAASGCPGAKPRPQRTGCATARSRWRFRLRRTFLLRARSTVSLPGLKQPVGICRDRYGLPHICAGSLEDVYFTLGSPHATDRFFRWSYCAVTLPARWPRFSADPCLRTLSSCGRLVSSEESALVVALGAPVDLLQRRPTEFTAKHVQLRRH